MDQKEQDRLRAQRYRDKKKGVTGGQSVTDTVTLVTVGAESSVTVLDPDDPTPEECLGNWEDIHICGQRCKPIPDWVRDLL